MSKWQTYSCIDLTYAHHHPLEKTTDYPVHCPRFPCPCDLHAVLCARRRVITVLRSLTPMTLLVLVPELSRSHIRTLQGLEHFDSKACRWDPCMNVGGLETLTRDLNENTSSMGTKFTGTSDHVACNGRSTLYRCGVNVRLSWEPVNDHKTHWSMQNKTSIAWTSDQLPFFRSSSHFWIQAMS